VLERLGLLELFIDAGAIPAKTASFYSAKMKSPTRLLKPPALCLSRFRMDALLAAKFQDLGGELREGERAPRFDPCEHVVHASGRRVRPVDQGWRWFGLKVHARDVVMEADLEMHVTANGYVGLCRLTGGVVNVCGLFRSRPGMEAFGAPRTSLLSGTPGTPLYDRLVAATFDETSFCSVAGLSLRPKRSMDLDECCIGDALTMIPPVTGNGMSMAFESAEMAIAVLTDFHRGELSWSEARAALAIASDKAFRRRLAWASLLQWMMFTPVFRGSLATAALHAGWLWRLMFSRTR